MTLTVKDIEAFREGWDFEAKKAAGRDGRGHLPDDFWPTYSAMANTGGGKVVLGVKQDAGGALTVHGLTEPERVITDLWNLLSNKEKVSANVLAHDGVRVEDVDGARVVVIEIPRATREHRPVYLGRDPLKGTYVRVHDGDRMASEDRVRRMLADSDRNRPRDSRVLAGFGLSDIDVQTLERYRNVLASRKPDHPFLGEDSRGFLEQIGAWSREREEKIEGLTLAGLLLFGREHAIRQHLPAWFLEYQEHSSRSLREGRRWEDRVYPDGTWTANLLQFYWRVFPQLVSGLQVPFDLDASGTRRAETPIHEALRESLVNALIHADHSTAHGVHVVRRPGGFEFRNAGLPLVAPEQMRRGGESQCRNPVLQHAFTLIGLGERAGSGIPTILNAWREQHWRAPGIDLDPDNDITTMRLDTLSLLPAEALNELTERFGDAFTGLDSDARLVVATAHVETKVTNRRMQELTSRHPRDLTFMFKGLVDAGLLVTHGDRQGAWYSVAGALPSPEDSTQSSGDSTQSFGNSTQSSPDSTQSSAPGEGGALSARPFQQGFTFAEAAGPTKVAGSKWAKKTDIEAAILEACSAGFVTADQLATKLKRKARSLQQNYLRSMVADGRLELRYPETPTRPDQAYRAVVKVL